MSASNFSPSQNNQIFTRRQLVDRMCNLCEPQLSNYQKKVFEPGCGNGNFLVEVLHRRLLSIGADPQKALQTLANLYGIDIDETLVSRTRSRLRAVLSDFAGNDNRYDDHFFSIVDKILVKNIIVGDFLKDPAQIIFYDWLPQGDGFDFRAQPHTLTEILQQSRASSPITLRTEQSQAIERTAAYWQSHHDGGADASFLWNAKPRFGKTFTAYQFCLRIQAQRILIVSNRPTISDAWSKDFFEYIAPGTDYIFAAAKSSDLLVSGQKHHVYSRAELLRHPELLKRPLFFFISLQDLKGKDGSSSSFKTKNQWIFKVKQPWDLLIIDESHEGVRTEKTSQALAQIQAGFRLYLSGTPFLDLANHEFAPEQIYHWSYLDEQKLKHVHRKDPANPYASLPQLRLFSYKPQDFFGHNISIPATEIFRAKNGQFLHPEFVQEWLDLISQPRPDSDLSRSLPFVTPANRAYHQHTFWLLSHVDECRVMAKMLASHPYFKEYQTVIVAGKDQSATSNPKHALSRVRQAINASTRTITLSCGRLTTGVTVPEWTAVLMLGASDLRKTSPAQYLQAAFRTQNPWPGANLAKDHADIYDWVPNRAMLALRSYAVNLCSSHPDDPLAAISDLLQVFPAFISTSTTNIAPLSASQIINLPAQLSAREVVDSKFSAVESLFTFSSNADFPPAVRRIIDRFYALGKHGFESPRSRPNPRPRSDSSQQESLSIGALRRALARAKALPAFAQLTPSEWQAVETLLLHPAESSSPSAAVSSAVRKIRNMASASDSSRSHKKPLAEAYHAKIYGFSSVIPFLLHLYGEFGQDLSQLIAETPDRIFQQLTGISKADFAVLDQNNFFQVANCCAAIQEFLSREQSLASYYRPAQINTIFANIPLQREYVFTPNFVVQRMLDYLAEQQPDLFQSPDRTFLDICSKSGIFSTAIIHRLFQHLRPTFQNDHDCLLHILSHQVFAWSPDEIAQQATLQTILSFHRFGQIRFSAAEIQAIKRHFVVYNPSDGKGIINYVKVMQDIVDFWEDDVKFDVILGNPPYQSGRRQVYADFYRLAVDLDPELLCLIFPLGWQKVTNMNGLKQLNNPEYKRDPHLVLIDNYYENDGQRIFSEIGTGGVNIVLRNRQHDNGGKIRKFENGQSAGEFILPVEEHEIKKPEQLNCLRSLTSGHSNIASLGSTRQPYGFPADSLRHPAKYQLILHDKSTNLHNIRLFGLLENGERGYKCISRQSLPKINPRLDSYKLFVPKAWGNMSRNVGLGGSYSNICLARPHDACTETFIEFGPFASQAETLSMAKYFLTKFFRACLFLAKTSQNTARNRYRYVPIPDFSKVYWQQDIDIIDEQLFDEFQVPDSSRDFIRCNFQTRSEDNIEIL